MISLRTGAALGMVGWATFWVAMMVLGALRPSYSQSVDAISELGARGTPNALLWNVFGFIGPGLLSTLGGQTIAASVDARRTRSGQIARWLLPAFGLTVAGQGLIPAVMLNGELVTTSWSTRAHLLISLLSGVVWLTALLSLSVAMKRNSDWRSWYLVNIAALVLTIVVAFILGGLLPGGLAQRLADAVVFAWFLVVSVQVIRLEARGRIA